MAVCVCERERERERETTLRRLLSLTLYLLSLCCDFIFRITLGISLTVLIRTTSQREATNTQGHARDDICSDCSFLLTDRLSCGGWNCAFDCKSIVIIHNALAFSFRFPIHMICFRYLFAYTGAYPVLKSTANRLTKVNMQHRFQNNEYINTTPT